MGYKSLFVQQSTDIKLGDSNADQAYLGNGVGLIPYAGGLYDANLGAHTIQLGKEEVVVDKAKHQTFLKDELGNVLFRKQTYYWNGSAWIATYGYGFGVDAMKNNKGHLANGFGYQALQSNIGTGTNGVGYQALQNNTGVSSAGFGHRALQNNTGRESNGFGYQALQNNIGATSNGVGFSALANNTGYSVNGVGYQALESNIGITTNGFGYQALQNNISNSCNGFGYQALWGNTGAYSNGLGHQALWYNMGEYSSGVGYTVLLDNIGANSNGFGHRSLINNIGANVVGFGHQTLQYNQSSNNTSLGYNAYGNFIDNVAGSKTFDFTAIDITTDEITIPAHGFGANNTWVNLRYNQGTTTIGGLLNNYIYQFYIVDANTIQSYRLVSATNSIYHGTNITSAGTGTGHTLTPQFTYSNTTSLGANSQPTKSNQVMLGDSAVTEVAMGNGKVLATTEDLTHVIANVYNNDSVILTNGMCVRVSGVGAGLTGVVRALADNTTNALVYGIVDGDIPIGGTGKVNLLGTLTGVNTTGFIAGDLLFLSDTVPGGFTKTPPVVISPVGQVLTVNAAGSIMIKARGIISLTAIGETKGNSGTQTLTTTAQSITAFDSTGDLAIRTQVTHTGTAPNQTSIISPLGGGSSGYYRAVFSITATSVENVRIIFEVFRNGVFANITGTIDLSNAAIDYGSTSISAITAGIITPADSIELRARLDSGTALVTYVEAVLNIEKIGTD